MTKTVTRAVIIDAIKKEKHLTSGSFFDNGNVYGGRYIKNCDVCAVGAVLRRVSFETYMRKKRIKLSEGASSLMDGHDPTDSNIRSLVRKKAWMAALSNVFEQAVSIDNDGSPDYGKKLEKGRARAIAFVQKYFPRTIKITINN